MFVGTELREDVIEALLLLCQGRTGFFIVDLGGMQVFFGPLHAFTELEDFYQIVTVPLQIGRRSLELSADAPFVSPIKRQLFLLLLLVFLGRVAERFIALKLRRLISL